MSGEFRYIFGPVPSRRLGRSLGVDLVPFKTCTYDCAYCQLGRTTNKTVVRKPYVPAEDVMSELERRLSQGVHPDYITLSGSGEPTLNSEIGKVVEAIKHRTGIPIAVLTNGSLLWMKEVRGELLMADVVMPSLDAARPNTFEAINRPHPDIEFSKMLQGLIDFRREYRGKIWLEIFLAKGINDGETELNELIRMAELISPDRIDLNTAVRPPADNSVKALTAAELESIASRFTLLAVVIAPLEPSSTSDGRVSLQDVAAMLRRRPCTALDVANAFDVHLNEAVKYLEVLKEECDLIVEDVDGVAYYRIASGRDMGKPRSSSES